MKKILILCLLAALFVCSAFGGEFQVNTHTTWDQADPDVAFTADGGFLVVWRSYGQDGSSNGIFAQWFDPNHNPAGEEFQVNTIITGNQTEPAVAIGSPAGSVVTWRGPSITDPNREDIFARWFDPNGFPVTDDVQINDATIGRNICPQVAMNKNGECVIIWESVDFPEEGDRTICGQCYDVTGRKFGEEFIVNEELSPCRYPDVAMDPNGNFAVVWMVDKSSNSIRARVYNFDGSAKTEPIYVSTIAFDSIARPAIAMDQTGCFVVTWDGDPNLASLDDIHARLFDPNGTALGEQFIVNTTLEQAQQNPRIAMNDFGEFVIVWESMSDPNVNERDVFGQRFDNYGNPIGGEFRLNTYIEDDQRRPAIAAGSGGRFVTVWQSNEQDGSRFGVFGEICSLIGSADFNYDGIVNFRDFWILAEQWHMTENPLIPDLIDDGVVNVLDLMEFCRQWLISSILQ
ncbi:MAG: hypothetical protein JW715_12130 [Sedimentisphaerales bacterium]|nr:hypothetical protein [Sedimentisphaerales bacterium]